MKTFELECFMLNGQNDYKVLKRDMLYFPNAWKCGIDARAFVCDLQESKNHVISFLI